jgi:hypothetical protein
MLRRLVLAVLVAAGATGCEAGGSQKKSFEAERAQPKAVSSEPAQAKKIYGAPISAAADESLAAVLGEPERFAGKNVVVSGHVRRACTRMGCWMELSAGTDPTTPACRVTFHGHGFFVPRDSAGSEARVEGRLELVKVSPAHAAHLEEEGARVADKDGDGSAREVHLVASGVELYRRGG